MLGDTTTFVAICLLDCRQQPVVLTFRCQALSWITQMLHRGHEETSIYHEPFKLFDIHISPNGGVLIVGLRKRWVIWFVGHYESLLTPQNWNLD